jgi:hypothetical protein
MRIFPTLDRFDQFAAHKVKKVRTTGDGSGIPLTAG